MNDCQYYQHYSSFWADVVKTIKNKSEVYEPYKNVLNKIRYGIIQNMSKPEEVIIIEDEYHNIVREKLKDTNKIKIYHVMASTLQNLMIIDEETTTSIMVELLKKQTGTWAGSLDYDSDEDDCPKHGSNPNWTYREINSICWAIGSVSGIMNVEKESKFLVLALKELLNMNEVLDVQASKAVIASDVMYIIGQYPRFLSNNTKFCRTVMEKLFEFMNGNMS
ncbi:MAG: Exportin-1 [Paramarteilia canceri]